MSTATTVSAFGVAVRPPPGWDVRIYRRPTAGVETTHAVVHAATFGLPGERGDYGDGAVQRMGRHDVFIALVEFHPTSAATALFRPAGPPPPFAPDDFGRSSLQRALAGQAGAQRWFSERGRAWCLYAVIGSWSERATVAQRANEFVAGIAIGPDQP